MRHFNYVCVSATKVIIHLIDQEAFRAFATTQGFVNGNCKQYYMYTPVYSVAFPPFFYYYLCVCVCVVKQFSVSEYLYRIVFVKLQA